MLHNEMMMKRKNYKERFYFAKRRRVRLFCERVHHTQWLFSQSIIHVSTHVFWTLLSPVFAHTFPFCSANAMPSSYTHFEELARTHRQDRLSHQSIVLLTL